MRQSNQRRIVMLGGTGFVGRHIATRLVRAGHRVKILSRNREDHRELLVLPTVDVVTADVYDAEELVRHFERAYAVINLVGILNEKGHSGEGFRRAHLELTRTAANAAKKAGVPRFLQMSALGAATDAPSHYQRSKGEAEKFLREQAAPLNVTIFRPSVIFGPGDGLMNTFAGLLRIAPVLPLACATTKFAPVHVGNVADAFLLCLEESETFGKTYPLCGPKQYTLLELVRYTRQLIGKRRLIVPLPDVIGKLQAMVFEFVPGKPFSLDNFNSAKVDNVCDDRNGLQELGIAPVSLESVAPTYLRGNAGLRQRYDTYRSAARRQHRDTEQDS